MPETCSTMGHLFVAVYRRPWRKLFRKERYWGCWYCAQRAPWNEGRMPR